MWRLLSNPPTTFIMPWSPLSNDEENDSEVNWKPWTCSSALSPSLHRHSTIPRSILPLLILRMRPFGPMLCSTRYKRTMGQWHGPRQLALCWYKNEDTGDVLLRINRTFDLQFPSYCSTRETVRHFGHLNTDGHLNTRTSVLWILQKQSYSFKRWYKHFTFAYIEILHIALDNIWHIQALVSKITRRLFQCLHSPYFLSMSIYIADLIMWPS